MRRTWTRRQVVGALSSLPAAAALDGCGSKPSPAGQTAPGNPLRVETLEPHTTHLRLTDLPQPFASRSASRSPKVVPRPPGAPLRLPEGFTVQVFADGLDKPRWLALAPDGAVLVTETRKNRIRRLRGVNGDGRAEEITTFASAEHGVDIPFGMAFSSEHFFLGNSDEVRRYRVRPGQASLDGEGERIAELPGGGYNQHWTRNVIVDAARDRLFVSVGSASNVSAEEPPRASVLTMGYDGSGARVFASGLRNPVGLALHPESGALFATVNERDELGDDLVPDYFAEVVDGAFYGWPYAYLAPSLLDPRRMQGDVSERPDLAARTRTPDVLFQAHSASLGVTFHPHAAFPEHYRTGAFACFRGSWNRSAGTGYKLVYLPFEGGRPVGSYEDFLTGFLIDPAGPTTWGRPVGILSMPDGSLLFTEEMNGVVYRVSFRG